MPTASCTLLGWLSAILKVLTLIGPAVFTTLQIYSLSRGNRILGGVVLMLSMAPFLINGSTIYQRPPINLPTPLNCSQNNNASKSFNIKAGSPDLPELLRIIGEPIRSFDDEDEDLQSLEFAPPQEQEDQSEPEGEIAESSRDAGRLA
ncbi:uncharacterized protein TRAVEDRAFT_49624 [Trametes versicolor FP-101664 SS1]|uniref:uncharacterized protein n=1 Tax=Trametes versicolor (strain FP-101664) TaxID=717944 RepID=UPI000462481C|nr:uncharacterized protein TRAVEDRAFT_49624 [Trametes versicolor FP-101664 SS1]EIW56802.1 hypothetical protein TRAVEDRAFT_49624 [Trametes versicolor FP-101664 SS1]